MARKRKTLPRDFAEQLKTKTPDEIIAVLDTCELDARGGHDKRTALHFHDLPDEVTRLLVERGLDIDTPTLGGSRSTPLKSRMGWHTDLSVLIELGAQVGRPGEAHNPLWSALYLPPQVRQLIAAGADVTVRDHRGQGLLDHALIYASNNQLEALAETARMLLDAGAPAPLDPDTWVTRLGEIFEFARERFDPDTVDEASAAMDALYAMFDVTPVGRRVMHDGVSPIQVGAVDVDERYDELFELLVPGSGPAATVQGEVIRITGKLRSEIFRNGGANWNAGFPALADALGAYLQTGTTVGDTDELRALAHCARFSTVDDETLLRLRHWAADWVQANPDPIPTPAHDYTI